MLGKELIDFIQTNKLEEVVVETEWVDQLVFTVILDGGSKELSYNWNFNGNNTITYYEWEDDKVDPVERREITTEESLKMRGLD